MHPLAASKKGGLHPVLAQDVDNPRIIAGDFIGLLAQIEGEGDEFPVITRSNLAYRVLPFPGERRQCLGWDFSGGRLAVGDAQMADFLILRAAPQFLRPGKRYPPEDRRE